MNLIYMCVFHQLSYIILIKLLIESLSLRANLQEGTDILIFTAPEFLTLLQKELSVFKLNIHYSLLKIHTLMDASCCKLHIFDYEHIDMYTKILYIDIDVLINSDINVLLNTDIAPDKIYAIEEGTIGNEWWGKQFFDFSKIRPETPAFSAGVLYFMKSPFIQQLFQNTIKQIETYLKNGNPIPVCLDQPFLVYNAITTDMYDNQLMKRYMINNPTQFPIPYSICHFPGGPGKFSSKYDKMTAAWKKMTAQ